MFLPDVTNIRSPITFAPVVKPTSCWIDPRYSTFGDITASGSVAADAGVASSSVASRAARRALIVLARTSTRARTCAIQVEQRLTMSYAPVDLAAVARRRGHVGTFGRDVAARHRARGAGGRECRRSRAGRHRPDPGHRDVASVRRGRAPARPGGPRRRRLRR